MKQIKAAFVFLFIFVSLVAVFILSGCAETSRNIMPQVAGQEVPSSNFIIDFDKRYNIVCSQYQSQGKTYENVKIIGYTGTEVKDISGRLSKSYGYFNHWLVVERMDGRKVYLPTSSISILEEVDQKK